MVGCALACSSSQNCSARHLRYIRATVVFSQIFHIPFAVGKDNSKLVNHLLYSRIDLPPFRRLNGSRPSSFSRMRTRYTSHNSVAFCNPLSILGLGFILMSCSNSPYPCVTNSDRVLIPKTTIFLENIFSCDAKSSSSAKRDIEFPRQGKCRVDM